MSELMFSDRANLLTDDLDVEVAEIEGDIATVKWSAAPESARRQARQCAAHVREALTGYRSWCAQTALPGEPRSRYRTAVPKRDRLAAKAKELDIGLRSMQRWVKLYLQEREVGLVSAKSVQPELGSSAIELFERTALEIMVEHTDMSKPSQSFFIDHAKARVIANYGAGAIPLPSSATAYRVLDKLERRHPLFSKSTKLNLSTALSGSEGACVGRRSSRSSYQGDSRLCASCRPEVVGKSLLVRRWLLSTFQMIGEANQISSSPRHIRSGYDWPLSL